MPWNSAHAPTFIDLQTSPIWQFTMMALPEESKATDDEEGSLGKTGATDDDDGADGGNSAQAATSVPPASWQAQGSASMHTAFTMHQMVPRLSPALEELPSTSWLGGVGIGMSSEEQESNPAARAAAKRKTRRFMVVFTTEHPETKYCFICGNLENTKQAVWGKAPHDAPSGR
jgi:hypothetical protein